MKKKIVTEPFWITRVKKMTHQKKLVVEFNPESTFYT